MGRGGFEPPKAEPTDLQSAPFDRFGISPAFILLKNLPLNFESENLPVFKGMQNYTLFYIIQIFKANSIFFFQRLIH